MSIISNSPTQPLVGTAGSGSGQKGPSPTMGTSVGSGSRPTSSRIKIETSAPVSPRSLSRDVAGSLK